MKKIMVLGRSGSGKSYFANKLSKHTGITTYHLDKLYFNPDWTMAQTKDEFNTLVEGIIDRDSWIIDGNYSSTMGRRVERADVIVFFDLSFFRCLYYVFKRMLFPDNNPADKHRGMKEKVDWKLIKQIVTYPTRDVFAVLSQNKKAKLFVIKDRSEANELLEELTTKNHP